MKKRTLAVIVGIGATAALLTAINGEKGVSPTELNQVDNPVAREYLLAAKAPRKGIFTPTAQEKANAYRGAIDNTSDPNLKEIIADYASRDLVDYANNPICSVSQMFCSLGFALEFEPSQEDKEKIIDSSMRTVNFYSVRGNHGLSIADFLITCAEHTSDFNKRKVLRNHVIDIYQSIVDSSKDHFEKAYYLGLVQNLRQSPF